VSGRAHVSIGDVLTRLRDEFPDVTISKIRFLESQGLIDPERTPSGYRKFYDADVERLRWILHQQKDHFLPLKVIKERLDDLDRAGRPVTVDGATSSTGSPTAAESSGAGDEDRGAAVEALFESARRASAVAEGELAAGVVADGEPDGPDELALGSSGVSLTRQELARAAELDDAELAELEEYGLVTPSFTSRERVLFDEDALAVARVAAGFMRFGIEARHLRMYRAFAEREASLFEQVLLPYRRQRNPEARARAQELLGELAGHGRRLRTALLQQSIRRSFGA